MENIQKEGTPKAASKRFLNQISPETPSSKRHLTCRIMDNRTVSQLSVTELQAMLTPLAKKEDIDGLKSELLELQNKNKSLSDKVDVLSSKCQLLEDQLQSVYIWKNSSNLIIKLNREGDDVEKAKERVMKVCAELSKEQRIVERSSIKQLRIGDNRKYLFKVFLSGPEKAIKIIQNTSALRGTDISISKDYPKSIREQQSKLLMIRRFLMRNSSNKPKMQGAALVDGAIRFTWSAEKGLVVSSGESLEEVLSKYHQTKDDLDTFLASGARSQSQIGLRA